MKATLLLVEKLMVQITTDVYSDALFKMALDTLIESLIHEAEVLAMSEDPLAAGSKLIDASFMLQKYIEKTVALKIDADNDTLERLNLLETELRSLKTLLNKIIKNLKKIN